LQFAAAIALIGTIALCALILDEAEQLSASERAELADRILESPAHDIPP